MSDQHYRRTREVVRVGGFGVGGWRLGGHRYAVGPLSVADASALLLVLAKIGEAWPKDAKDAISFVLAAPVAVLRTLVPLFVEGRVRSGAIALGALLESDRKRMSDKQALALAEAAFKVNDITYILDGFTSNGSEGERISLERIVDQLVVRYGCYTHEDVWKMPAQEFLSIAETCRLETATTDDVGGDAARGNVEKQLPITKDDLAMMRFVGWVNL